jgi:hypothetical protein
MDKVILLMRNNNYLLGISRLCTLKLNNSLAMKPQCSQDATKCAIQIQDTKYKKQISS